VPGPLGRVGLDGLGDDLLRDLLIGHGPVAVGVGRDLRPVDRDHPDRGQSGVSAKSEDLSEQSGQRPFVAFDEARDRRVIGLLVGGDHALEDPELNNVRDPTELVWRDSAVFARADPDGFATAQRIFAQSQCPITLRLA
jgi:hypothetical protein